MFFHFEFSIASALHECEQSQNRTVVVELGDSVSRVFPVTSLNITEYLSGDALTFVKNGDHVISRCAVSLHHSIECQSNDKRIGIYRSPSRENSVTLEINVTTSQRTDAGIYILRSGRNSCTLLKVNITVKETNPVCKINAFFPEDNKYLRLFCVWVPLDRNEQAYLWTRNRVLYGGSYQSNKNSLNIKVPLKDAFNKNKVPYMCTITQFGYVKTCRFNIHMQPKVADLNNDTVQFLPFKCCAPNGDIGDIWWIVTSRSGKATSLNMTGQSLTVAFYVDKSRRKSMPMIIACGKKTSDGLELHGTGKLILESQFYLKFSSAGYITQGSTNSGTKNDVTCLNNYFVNITAYPIMLENTKVDNVTAAEPMVSVLNRVKPKVITKESTEDNATMVTSYLEVSSNSSSTNQKPCNNNPLLAISSVALLFGIGICLQFGRPAIYNWFVKARNNNSQSCELPSLDPEARNVENLETETQSSQQQSRGYNGTLLSQLNERIQTSSSSNDHESRFLSESADGCGVSSYYQEIEFVTSREEDKTKSEMPCNGPQQTRIFEGAICISDINCSDDGTRPDCGSTGQRPEKCTEDAPVYQVLQQQPLHSLSSPSVKINHSPEGSRQNVCKTPWKQEEPSAILNDRYVYSDPHSLYETPNVLQTVVGISNDELKRV